jgi:hypothetical protein
MSRIPHAATQLITQVQAERKSATFQNEGDPDGFDTYRTISFDKGSSKWLAPILEAAEDPRIAETHLLKERLHVTFVPGVEADHVDEFPLAEVDAVLSE